MVCCETNIFDTLCILNHSLTGTSDKVKLYKRDINYGIKQTVEKPGMFTNFNVVVKTFKTEDHHIKNVFVADDHHLYTMKKNLNKSIL